MSGRVATAGEPSGTTAATPWMVSARHRTSAAVKPPEPFGAWHARRPGDAFTACGLPAAGWPIFWQLTLVQGWNRSCVGCQRAVYASRGLERG